MKNLFVVLASLLFLTATSFAQVTNTWVGGTPGQESNWNCHKNWSKYQVPDEFSDVIIPNVYTRSHATPIINKGLVRINSLFMDSGSLLMIEENARLVVYTYAEGLNSNNLANQGTLLILKEHETDGTGATAALPDF